jgi:regulator of protease activity HflC (stomatin/prohibitin superfamily)
MYYAIEIALGILAVVLLLVTSVKVFREYERGILFRLGRLGGIKGPGLVFIFPLIDRLIKADLRLVSIDVPRQEIMTRDNVPVTVDAVIYFQIIRPALAITVIENYYNSTFLIAQTTLRSVLGQSDLDELLSQRDIINQKLQAIIDKQTDPWGIKVPMVEIREVALPEEMKRAMAKQAEAERERRARIIEAEGEFQAAAKLVDAANIMSKNPISIQLRYLKTLSDISGRQGNTIVFPSPVDLLSPLIKKDNPKPTGDK